MKVIRKEDKKRFNPIELTITIESEEELCDMWHRLNAAASYINDNVLHRLKHDAQGGVTPLFNTLSDLIDENNLRE